MNDIEIINCLKEFLKYNHLLKYRRIDIVSITKDEYLAIQELLNLYNKEKEKNNSISIQYEKVVDKLEDLEQIEKEHKEENGRLREENKILRHGLEENTEEIDKLNVIIDLMAEQLTTPVHNKKWVIEYFTNKVEEDK